MLADENLPFLLGCKNNFYFPLERCRSG